jgi:hypothetical protein
MQTQYGVNNFSRVTTTKDDKNDAYFKWNKEEKESLTRLKLLSLIPLFYAVLISIMICLSIHLHLIILLLLC